MAGVGEHGQGTITELENGRYRIAVTMADGKRVWRRAKTPKQAERIRKALVEARELDLDPTRQTVADYLHSWIVRPRRRGRDRTMIGYPRIIEQRIIPDIGTVKLASLSRRKVQAWVDGLEGSPQTVRNCHAVLRRALGSATGDMIPLNPAIGVELPKVHEFHGSPLTTDEARRLLAVTADTRLAAFWRLAIVTGLREGELLGLTRDSLDGDTLAVTAQLQRVNRAWVLGPTKAGRSLDRVALDAETVRVVRTHLAKTAVERDPSWRYFGLMFVTETGEPYHAGALLRAFRVACDEAGISRRRVHDLRGTSATILKDRGVAEDTRMARLGHSTTQMARHYGKASERQDREAVEKLAEAIG